MTRRQFLSASLPVFALAACSEAPLAPLRVGSFVWPGYEPFFIARSLGYFSEKEMQFVEFPSAAESMVAFTNGLVDSIMLTLDEALRLVGQGHDLRVILLIDYSNGADAILARSGVQNISALKGRKVGIEANNLGAYILSRALEIHGVGAQEITSVSLRADKLEDEFNKGILDAIVTYEPYRSRLLSRGAKQIFDTTELPAEVLDVLIVRADAMEKYRATLRKLIQSWFGGVAHLTDKPQEAAARIATREQTTPEQFLASLKLLRFLDHAENSRLLAGGETSLVKLARKMSAFMQSSQLIQTPVETSKLFDGSFLKEAGR